MKQQAGNEIPPIVTVTQADMQKIDFAHALKTAKRRERRILALATAGYILVVIGIIVAFRSQVGVNRSVIDRNLAPWQIAAGILIILTGIALVITARCLYRPQPIVRQCSCGYCGVCAHECREDRSGGMNFPEFLYAAYSVGWDPICPNCGSPW